MSAPATSYRPRFDPFTLPVMLPALGVLVLLYFAIDPLGTRDQATGNQPAAHRSAAAQKRPEALMDGMLARGIFAKIEPRGGGLVRVYTGPTFAGLDFDAKQTFCGVVFAFYFDGKRSSDFIVVHDGRTGKKIGTMHDYGLRMY